MTAGLIRKILQTISVQKAKNVDWEDIAQDGKYIFIADVGNNYGKREKLTIYKVAKEMK